MRANYHLDSTPYRRKIYLAWKSMRQRCNNKNYRNYSYWGGRGIKICERWNNFDNFYEDLNDSYRKDLQLDRINNNENYYPKNCRWATRKEQALNTRNVERATRITFNGLTLTIHEWAEKMNIKRTTLDRRIHVYNWSVEDALKREVKFYER